MFEADLGALQGEQSKHNTKEHYQKMYQTKLIE